MTIATTGRQKALLTATLLACSSGLTDSFSFLGAGAGKRSLLSRPVEPLYRAGRNNPCPCGSGKKFKKCCIGRVKRPE